MNNETHAFDIQEAWEHVGYLYGCIISLFGVPFAIATRLILMRRDRRDLLAWLGPVEALARRILLLRALSMPKSNAPPMRPASGGVLIAFTDTPIEDIDPEPEKWRVRFCVMPRSALHRNRMGEPCKDARGGDITFRAEDTEQLRYACERAPMALGEAINDLNAAIDLYALNPDGPWADSVRFRHFLAHDYDDSALPPLVWDTIQRDLPKLDGALVALALAL